MESPTRAIIIALVIAGSFVGAWILSVGSRIPPAEHTVSNLALSRTGRWLAWSTPQGPIRIRNQESGATSIQIDFKGAVNDLQFSPDERSLAVAGVSLAIYSLEQATRPRLMRGDRRTFGSVRYNEDGETLLAVTGEGVIEIIDARSGMTRVRMCCSSVYGEVAFTPDGQAIVNAGHWPRLWDARSGKLLAALTANRQFETFRPIAFDLDRNTLVMGSQDGRVYAWNLTTRQLTGRSAAQPDYVDTLAVAGDGSVLFAGFGKPLRLWKPAGGNPLVWPGARPTSNLILSAGGEQVTFGTRDGTIESWDTRTGRRVTALRRTVPPGEAAEAGRR